MRILGIDYGEKRVGLAVSDELSMLAREFKIVSPAVFFNELESLLQELEIEKIVLGWPLNMSGSKTRKTLEVEEFAARIEKETNLPVILIDERLSSQMASKLPGGHKDIDSLAAQIILQNYLDQHKSNKL